MDYYGLRQKAFMMIDQTIRGAKDFAIDGIILKIENTCGFGEKFVRDRLDRMARVNHITIDREKDEVTWND